MSTKLVNAMTRSFCWSKRWIRFNLICSFILTAMAAWLAFDPSSKLVPVLGWLALVIQVCSFVFRILSEEKFDVGEQLRRANMLGDGLGYPQSSVRIAKLVDKAGGTGQTSAAGKPYYESTTPAGPVRLAEHLYESAFWTSRLADSAFRWFLFFAIVGIVIAVCAIAFTIFESSLERARAVTGAMLPVLAFWSAADVLAAALKFRKLREDADAVCNDAEVLLSKSGSLQQIEVVLLFSDYNGAVGSAPPIPDWVYWMRQDALNSLWGQRASLTP